MAGDILLYQTNIVPVGDDQRQHIELARDIAQHFNQRYGETFTVPEGVPGRGADQEPPGAGTAHVHLGRGAAGRRADDRRPDTIGRKFKAAVTDSGRDVLHDPESKPGVSNLIEIMSVATGEAIPEIEARYDGQGYGQFKDVAEAVVGLLAPIQEALPRATGGRRRVAAPACAGRGEGGSRGRADAGSRCTSGWASSG